MHIIDCPWCGPRSEDEFSCGGQSHITRPADPAATSDTDWAGYLYTRDNPRGLHFERWRHTFGCRQWFNVARDTVTHEIHAVYRMGDPRPDVGGAGS
ncbi:sarcosine oxidase subunit delta [Pseudohaliea sp.]|uniref:sarcosine oxidase subunit delta n=1 Tax=Pseudohaliea sp. TaxID=2740289 RepID=UPI0032EB5EFA